jgi:hypothetical protein
LRAGSKHVFIAFLFIFYKLGLILSLFFVKL